MKTIEMEIALMKYLNIRQNIIVPNVFWGVYELNYECDLVRLTKNNYATEIEIKISKADLKRDKMKSHNHNSKLFKYLYFAVPHELADFALTEIPERAGLFSVKKMKGFYRVDEIRKPLLNKNHRQWEKTERFKLAELGAMRILGLKRIIASLGAKLNSDVWWKMPGVNDD